MREESSNVILTLLINRIEGYCRGEPDTTVKAKGSKSIEIPRSLVDVISSFGEIYSSTNDFIR